MSRVILRRLSSPFRSSQHLVPSLSSSPSISHSKNSSSPDTSVSTPPSLPSSVAPRSFANAAWKELYNRQRSQLVINHQVPDVAVDAWVAPNAVLIGAVRVDDRASIWYGAILRADVNSIHIGSYASIGDRVAIQVTSSSPTGLSAETLIGRYVTIGASSALRSCVVEDESLIGQKCILMEGSLVEKHSVLADGSVLPSGCYVPSGELWAGNPAKFVRKLTADETAAIKPLAEKLYAVSQEHSAEFLPYSTAYIEAEKLKEKLLKAA